MNHANTARFMQVLSETQSTEAGTNALKLQLTGTAENGDAEPADRLRARQVIGLLNSAQDAVARVYSTLFKNGKLGLRSLEDYADNFNERIDGLAAAQGLSSNLVAAAFIQTAEQHLECAKRYYSFVVGQVS